jgi:hypothetical protein
MNYIGRRRTNAQSHSCIENRSRCEMAQAADTLPLRRLCGKNSRHGKERERDARALVFLFPEMASNLRN